MRELDPRIHPFRKTMDCRVKPGNDQCSELQPEISYCGGGTVNKFGIDRPRRS